MLPSGAGNNRAAGTAYRAGRDDVTALPAIPGGRTAAVLFATGTGARMYRAEVRPARGQTK